MAVTLGLIICLLLAGTSGANHEQFRIHSDPSLRLVGAETSTTVWPYMAVLTSGLLVRSLTCGGSLVSTTHVLTAAHCIDVIFDDGELMLGARITLGTRRLDSGGYDYRVVGNWTHQDWNENIDYNNDIGILLLHEEAFIWTNIQPIALNPDFIGGGVSTRITGYGRTAAGGAVSQILRELTMDTIEGSDCVAKVAQASIDLGIRAPAVNPDLELCVFHMAGQGTCNGDSGGPVVEISSGTQVGLVSWGFPCALGAPDMMVRLSAYKPWVDDIISA